MSNYELVEGDFDPYLQYKARQRRAMLMGANRCIRCRRYNFGDYAVCNNCAGRHRYCR